MALSDDNYFQWVDGLLKQNFESISTVTDCPDHYTEESAQLALKTAASEDIVSVCAVLAAQFEHHIKTQHLDQISRDVVRYVLDKVYMHLYCCSKKIQERLKCYKERHRLYGFQPGNKRDKYDRTYTMTPDAFHEGFKDYNTRVCGMLQDFDHGVDVIKDSHGFSHFLSGALLNCKFYVSLICLCDIGFYRFANGDIGGCDEVLSEAMKNPFIVFTDNRVSGFN
ncbi:hypothetical protein H4219_006451 [Mycoemilia scoparia]|uniref:Uncharacterized protein n=1 Tax=Mycoemilia scoparia TaxID=417184 RepID=A0A9W8DHB3_9FUNG|nr:hypothetical protein H4219_006451 [Mycoemilia scoparia]